MRPGRLLPITLTATVVLVALGAAAPGLGSAASSGSASAVVTVRAPAVAPPAVPARPSAVAPGLTPAATATSVATGAMVLKFPGIQGESVQPGYLNQIDVFAYSWGVANVGSSPSYTDLDLSVVMDRSVAALQRTVSTGVAIDGVTFTVLNKATPATPNLTVVLQGARITSLSLGGAVSEDVGISNLSLSFTRQTTTFFKGATRFTSCYDLVLSATC